MSLFEFQGHVCGDQFSAVATARGREITIDCDGVVIRARSIDNAISMAADFVSSKLRPAVRTSAPWGLAVSVAGVSAVYGEWPKFTGRPNDTLNERSPVVRIRRKLRYDEPQSSISNAIEILRAYLPRVRSRRKAA